MFATGTLAALNDALTFKPGRGTFNLARGAGLTGTVAVEKSLDGGASFLAVAIDAAGTAATLAAATAYLAEEVDAAATWRIRCSAYSTGSCSVTASSSL